jgi:hypothetical protein
LGINNEVQKVPPFFEFFLQRIQAYFSNYKYEDQSRPVKIPLNVENGITQTPDVGDEEVSDILVTTDMGTTTQFDATDDV